MAFWQVIEELYQNSIFNLRKCFIRFKLVANDFHAAYPYNENQSAMAALAGPPRIDA